MIAFILQDDWGVLGSVLIKRLVDAGYKVSVFVRNGQKGDAGTLTELPLGVTRTQSLGAAVKDAETILTVLSTSQEVEDVYLGEGGILEYAAPASLFIDMSTSNPRLAKELHALAAVHDHSFVEAPFDGGAEGFTGAGLFESFGYSKSLESSGSSGSSGSFENSGTDALKLYAAGEPDNLIRALPILHALTPRVIDAGLPGSGAALKLASQIALANAIMGVVEAIAFATAAGVEKGRVLEAIEGNAAASAVVQAFGRKILDEEFDSGCDLRLFFNDLAAALEAADEFDLALPGLETAHQLYDLLVLVGGGNKGIHALALIYYDEARCAAHGLNWELAQRAMDVYERVNDNAYDDYDYDDYDDDYDYDDEECDDLSRGHLHHHHHHRRGDDGLPSMGSYFSSN
ncbi:MAG: NAD(P)-dependent oxidoreductase [Coriobacteriales bacterium]|jgi:3-hydroxyisobutyrate dehydrogenase|nr:NAD(P)-dependent oxidoreductase [Coriobacteriales bacterium]